MQKLRIVAIGGGTGLPALLSGLSAVCCRGNGAPPCETELSAIVTVADDGGSSGRLRRCFDIPAVGDLRNCLVALSNGQSLLQELFQHRFPGGDGLQGHALGNLILTALHQTSGSLGKATHLAGRLLASRGRVLPVTETPLTLCAEMQDGTVLRGESQIPARGRRIARIWSEPQDAEPFPAALEAIHAADGLVFGPGSLYTSIVPNLLVGGVTEAIRRSGAIKIFACNLMTQPGETEGLSAADHVRVLQQYLGWDILDVCLMNFGIDPARCQHYHQVGAEPVQCDSHRIARMGVAPIHADLLSEEGERLRHDPVKLGRLVLSIVRAAMQAQRRSPASLQLAA